MFINKIGYEHKENGTNCQDYGFVDNEGNRIVCDGCSEGKHSEVGAKLYCYLAGNCRMTAEKAFLKLVNFFGNSAECLKDYLSFTVLELLGTPNEFVVRYCGDGYIILQDNDGNITFEELTDGEYPKYFIYNYIDEKYLRHYKDGVSFSTKEYSTKQYRKIGIASDGLRFILQADESLKNEFIECLKSGKEMKLKLFINRNQKIFKDDITIVF